MFTDIHAHLYSEKYEDVDRIVKNARDFNLKRIICCGSDLKNSAESLKLALKYEDVYACVGVHPDDVEDFGESEVAVLEELAKNKKVVGIGEIGLDYYTSEVSKEKQKSAFIMQMQVAHRLKLPMVIHCREATGDMIEILKENKHLLEHGVVIHCFNKNPVVAKIFLDLGCYLSVGGCLTFANTEKLKESIRQVPIERLLLETDCPYMTPVPFRGQTNEPKNVVIVAEEIARLKGITPFEVGERTTQNAERLFRF